MRAASSYSPLAAWAFLWTCLLYTAPSPRDRQKIQAMRLAEKEAQKADKAVEAAQAVLSQAMEAAIAAQRKSQAARGEYEEAARIFRDYDTQRAILSRNKQRPRSLSRPRVSAEEVLAEEPPEAIEAFHTLSLIHI